MKNQLSERRLYATSEINQTQKGISVIHIF